MLKSNLQNVGKLVIFGVGTVVGIDACSAQIFEMNTCQSNLVLGQKTWRHEEEEEEVGREEPGAKC